MHTAVASAETLNQPTSSNTNGAAAEQDASAFLLESLLHELIFWEPTPKEFLLRKRSHSVNAVLDSAVVTSPHRKGELRHVSSCGNGATMNNGTYIHNDAPQQQCHRLQPSKNQQQPSNATKGLQLQQQQQQPRSPTLQDLQAACHWQKAVDPATGRTYYYDVLTRQTQWEKPREIRAIEKRIKKDQRKKDEAFFREMEANVLASLARGERIPCYSHFPKEGPPQEPLPPVAQSRPQSVRVRTISGMNELLLAQLQHPIPLGRVASSPSRALVEGRPPLPRPPPSTPLAFASATTQHLGSDQSQHQSKPNQMPMAAEDDLALSPEDDHKMSTHAGGDADDALLQGEDLLDGLVADLEVSDDDSENDSIPTAAAKPKAEVPAAAAKGGHNGGGIKKVSHIRRNTAGTVHVKGTMEKPDIDGTIHVVCGVIRAHIEQSLVHNKSAQSPSTVHVNLDIFRDDYEGGNKRKNSSSMPTLQEIKAFYREFYQRSQMEFDAIIMSLIYVERLIKETNGALMPTPENWGSVVFSCMILASKVWDDLSMWNIDFSNVSVNSGVLSSFSLKRINQLELAVLVCLNFAVTIPGSEYAKYYYLLRNMMIRGGLLDPFAAHKPLSKDEKDRLEDRTNHYQDSKLNTDEIPRRRQARSVDWSVLSGGSDGADFQLLSAAGQGSYRPEIVAGPVLRENVCLEQLIPMSATRS